MDSMSQQNFMGLFGGLGGSANGSNPFFGQGQMQQQQEQRANTATMPALQWRRYESEPLSFFDRLRNEIDEWLKL